MKHRSKTADAKYSLKVFLLEKRAKRTGGGQPKLFAYRVSNSIVKALRTSEKKGGFEPVYLAADAKCRKEWGNGSKKTDEFNNCMCERLTKKRKKGKYSGDTDHCPYTD